ncbi:helix-turn-helix domain-containing protein [Companilactobacillus sp.]|uniref:helix-turn-helix transcriptional regulator n=1 Tax=Companilactobacillus sp. TaxID=2767905 RepID=UPI00261BEF25|nr:helix-turn-helix domain-containing protein [Companilactobacillus sp.]
MSAPSETLKEVIEDSGLTQQELMSKLQITSEELSDLMNDEIAITPEMALKFEDVFKVPATFWNKLTKNYIQFKTNSSDEKIAR